MAKTYTVKTTTGVHTLTNVLVRVHERVVEFAREDAGLAYTVAIFPIGTLISVEVS